MNPNPYVSKPPEITEAMRAYAKQIPGQFLYMIDETHAPDGADGAVPPEGIIGAYPIDDKGDVTPLFSVNTRYKGPKQAS